MCVCVCSYSFSLLFCSSFLPFFFLCVCVCVCVSFSPKVPLHRTCTMFKQNWSDIGYLKNKKFKVPQWNIICHYWLWKGKVMCEIYGVSFTMQCQNYVVCHHRHTAKGLQELTLHRCQLLLFGRKSWLAWLDLVFVWSICHLFDEEAVIFISKHNIYILQTDHEA